MWYKHFWSKFLYHIVFCRFLQDVFVIFNEDLRKDVVN
jgi:hypothetical protein